MHPDDIRKLYQQAGAAAAAEAAATEQRARTDPGEALAFLETTFALGRVDEIFARLASRAIGAILVRDILERAKQDDAYALACADAVFTLMHEMAAASKRPARGKPRAPKSA
jgi:hypothetical protein